MCGRYVLEGPASRLLEFFEADFWTDDQPLDWTNQFNIAPTATVPVIRVNKQGRRVLIPHRWGLIPSWAKDLSVGARMNNARAETVAQKPSFRVPFRRYRCLVPASGYYEWQSPISGLPKAPKQPWYIHPSESDFLAMAGVCDHWTTPDGQLIMSFAIVTTEAHPSIQAIHDRMPVMLEASNWASWLNPNNQDTPALEALLQPSADLYAHKVSRAVSATGANRRDDRGLIAEISE